MSTSPAHSADKLGQLALSYGGAKDEGLLRALSSIPDFPFVDAIRRPVDRRSDHQVRPATTLLPPPYPSLQAGEGISIFPPPPAAEGRAEARDSEVKQGETIIIPPNETWPNETWPNETWLHEREIHQPHGDKPPPRDLTPDWVAQPRGYVDLRTPRLRRRRGYSLKKSLVTSAIVTMVGCALVVEILILVDDDFPSLPRFASAPRPAPPPTELSEFRAIINLSEPERMTQAIEQQPAVSLQPTAQLENQPAVSGTGVTLPHTVPDAGYEKTVGTAPAMRQPPSIATPELTPLAPPASVARPKPLTIAAPDFAPIARPEIARAEPTPIRTPEARSNAPSEPRPIARPEPTPALSPIARLEGTPGSPATARPEPTLQSPLINRAPPHVGNAVAADRAGFLFADSNVRYLTRTELQGLSADRLHIARNEIFARKGRYFKDDALRTYFSQFPWYEPRAWDVPLGPVERANVDLIQSIEAPAAASRSIMAPVPAQAKADDGVAFADLSHRYLTLEELQGLSADELAIVRNEIFARKGRYFKDDALRSYFSQFPWYQPRAWDVPLSPVEQANVKLVQSLEQTASTPRQAPKAGRAPPM
jgi:YARHG domain